MADYVPVSLVKEQLLECPVCHEEYDDGHRIPRRMPCCFQSVCQPCLEELMRQGGHLSCPHCRYQHHLPDGVSTLPKEHLIIRMLDFLKIQKGRSFPCTNCPEKNPAVSRCDDCGRFICQGCIDLHQKLAVLKEHKPVTFEEMRELPAGRLNIVHKCSKHNQVFHFYCQTCSEVICTGCTVVDHKNHDIVSIEDAHTDKSGNVIEKIAQVKAKEENLKSRVLGLKEKRNEIESSCKIAKCETNQKFQDLMEQLQKRRDAHLDDIDDQSQRMMSEIDVALDENTMLLTRLQSSREYITEMRAKVDAIEDINLITSSMKPLQDMLDQTQQDVAYERTGVAYVPANVDYLDQCIKTTGLVRSVTFTPTTDKRIPSGHDVVMSPASFPQGPVPDATISTGKNTFTCPRVEWDPSTASIDVNIEGSTVSNMEPDSSVHNTGCRFKQAHLVTSIRPLIVTGDQQMLLSLKMTFTTKKVFDANIFISVIALTPTPVDTAKSQPNGVSVQVATSSEDSAAQLYLKIVHNNILQFITPVWVNQAGASGNIFLLLLLDGSRGVVSVVDADEEKVIGQIRGVKFDDPMWLLVNSSPVSSVEVKCEVISGEAIKLSENTKRILSELK